MIPLNERVSRLEREIDRLEAATHRLAERLGVNGDEPELRQMIDQAEAEENFASINEWTNDMAEAIEGE